MASQLILRLAVKHTLVAANLVAAKTSRGYFDQRIFLDEIVDFLMNRGHVEGKVGESAIALFAPTPGISFEKVVVAVLVGPVFLQSPHTIKVDRWRTVVAGIGFPGNGVASWGVEGCVCLLYTSPRPRDS